MDTLIKQVLDYCAFLKKEYFGVTIHTRIGFLDRYMYQIAPFHIHYNPYCIFVKSTPALWDQCIENQKKVYKKCEKGMFYGMCHCGVCEFAVPFYHKGLLLGFISIGSFQDESGKYREKLRRISEKYCIPEKSLMDCYLGNLKKEAPPQELVKTLVAPLAAMLEMLYIEFCETYRGRKMPEENQTYSFIVHYIRKNYMKKIKLGEIAAHTHFSTSYIAKLFHKRMGCTIGRYLLKVRMEEAELLLQNTRLSVQDISALTGFSDANYFTAVFSKEHGVSPLRYRKAAFEMEG